MLGTGQTYYEIKDMIEKSDIKDASIAEEVRKQMSVVGLSLIHISGGKNYPPEPLMILSHRGNPVDEERQGYWYLSSREHCILSLIHIYIYG